MTFYAFAKTQLINNGMFDSQADEVMAAAIQDSKKTGSVNNVMDGRWFDSIDDYPSIMQQMIFISIKPIALEYIKKNIPQAWFRPIFDNEHPLAIKFRES